MDNFEVKLEFQTKELTILGEGPSWDPVQGLLYWVDIKGQKVHVYDVDTKVDRTVHLNALIGAVVPRAKGGVVVALQTGLYALDLQTEKLELLSDIESDKPENRFNDGKVDPRGRFVVGTMENAEKHGPLGALYSLDTDLSLKTLLAPGQTQVSNGLAWTADGKTMYYIDSPLKRVDAFDYDLDTGKVSNRRTVIKIENGYPDGMTIDKDGMLWVAHWEGSCVTRWNPQTGELLRTVTLPVSKVTSCCFGGKHLDRLYITSASVEVDTSKEPFAGSLFVLETTGTSGRPELPFQG